MIEASDWFSKYGRNYSYLQRPWFDYYANAMKINRFFKCERCNRCCNFPAEVCPEDIVRIAHHLDKSVKAFVIEVITENDDGSRYLNYPCPFLTERGCKIYQVRPLSCALYPFFVTHDPLLPYDPTTLPTAALQITRDCMLANRIFSTLIDLCGEELSKIFSCNIPEYIKEAFKDRDKELDERFSSEAPTGRAQRLFLPFRVFNLFVEQLQSRHGTL